VCHAASGKQFRAFVGWCLGEVTQVRHGYIKESKTVAEENGITGKN